VCVCAFVCMGCWMGGGVVVVGHLFQGGLDGHVSSAAMSLGQKQQLCIARALLCKVRRTLQPNLCKLYARRSNQHTPPVSIPRSPHHVWRVPSQRAHVSVA
jgi:hypothetical protein